MSCERYAIRVMCIGDSNSLKGVPIARYVLVTQIPIKSNNNITPTQLVANMLTARREATPDLYTDKEEAIIKAYEIQFQLDNLRPHIKSTEHSVEYFVRPVVWNIQKYDKDCRDSTWLTSKWKQHPVGTLINESGIIVDDTVHS